MSLIQGSKYFILKGGCKKPVSKKPCVDIMTEGYDFFDTFRIQPVREPLEALYVDIFDVDLLRVAFLEVSLESGCEIGGVVADEGFVKCKCRRLFLPHHYDSHHFLGAPKILSEDILARGREVTYAKLGSFAVVDMFGGVAVEMYFG